MTNRTFTVKAFSEWSGISVRKIRDLLKEESNPLPHFRVRGQILIRYDEYLDWLENYRVQPVRSNEEIDKITSKLLQKS